MLNAMLDADAHALVFATPIYSCQLAGTLKRATDMTLGPFTDTPRTTRVMENKKRDDSWCEAQPDPEPRVLKPRVMGFMAAGGSQMLYQSVMALPTLHQFAYSLLVKVVEPGAVVLAGEAMARAAEVNHCVATQVGRAFDETKYRGPVHEGACLHCHLAKIDLFGALSDIVIPELCM